MKKLSHLDRPQNAYEFQTIDKAGKYLLIFGLLFIVVGPWLFTREGFVDFTNKGEIGDTIGGITSPIVNLIGAFLVYLSFRAQMKANIINFDFLYLELQGSDYLQRKEQILNIFKQTKQFWDELNFKQDNINYKVFDYLNLNYRLFLHPNRPTSKDFIKEYSVQFRKLLLAMKYFHYYYEEVKNCKLKDRDKDMLLDQLTFLLFENFKNFITFSKSFRKDPKSKPTIQLNDEIYKSYFILYDKIVLIRSELISLKGYGFDVENNPDLTIS